MEDIEKKEAVADVINDLIRINNDRIEGYKKAIAEINEEDEPDLKGLFNRMIAESLQFKSQLEPIVAVNDGDIAKDALFTGKLYRTWMGVKAFLTAGGKRTILSSCETGEDAVQHAYEQALDNKDLPENVQALIKEQKSILKGSHDMIRVLRDKAVEEAGQKGA